MSEETVLISEIIKDAYFFQYIDKSIASIKKNRNNRKPAGEGRRYKRDWYDRLYEADQLNAQYFIEQIPAIWNRRSLLGSNIRSIIEEVCNDALYATVKLLKQKEKEATEATDNSDSGLCKPK